MSEAGPLPPLLPFDEHNRRLQEAVHPPDWANPEPAARYNLVVIGGGTAGLVTAAGAAGLGAKVALVERDLLGGDCLNVGCVPSKALLAAARRAADVRNATEFGVDVPGEVHVDFPCVMERMRRLRASIAPHDSAARFRQLGVDVFLGAGRFAGPDTVVVGDRTLRFRKAVIATGARAALPPIPGLAVVGCLTNETVFSLVALPARLAVVGGGPIGSELAQAFARFGSQVVLIEQGPHVLPREDSEAARIVQASMIRDGVRVETESSVVRVERRGAAKILHVERGGLRDEIEADEILVGLGRAPNVEGLGLEAAGVRFDVRRGVEVDDRLRTSNPRILAAGDVCSRFKFTHAADFLARIAIRNALFLGRSKASALTIPWCTYTSPELGHVGLTEAGAQERGIAVDTITLPWEEVDRTVLEGETEGFVRVHVRRGTDAIVGATIVARNAGDLIGTVSLAMTQGIGLKRIAATIFPYPTAGEVLRKVGDRWNRTRLTPFVQGLFARWLRWTR
jgi:pyruvate/2-oxoglutarate dehydrogenase complex dihydrolipoamide dehydrogenase (E3) component